MVEPYRALRRVHPKRQIAGNVATLRDLDEYFGRAVRVPGRNATALTQAADQRQHSPTAEKVASAFSTTLADRGMFCDLLAQAPLNLERNVSLEAVRAFKLVTHNEVDAIVEVMRRLRPCLTQRDCIDIVAAATSLSGAFWQMANPGPEVAALYRSDASMTPFPMLDGRLHHAVFEIEPLVRRILTAMLKGMLGG